MKKSYIWEGGNQRSLGGRNDGDAGLKIDSYLNNAVFIKMICSWLHGIISSLSPSSPLTKTNAPVFIYLFLDVMFAGGIHVYMSSVFKVSITMLTNRKPHRDPAMKSISFYITPCLTKS